jgi:outer membrane lipoprotein-sorting protein
MTVKILKIFLMILGVMVISGCIAKQTYVDRIVEVPVVQILKRLLR